MNQTEFFSTRTPEQLRQMWSSLHKTRKQALTNGDFAKKGFADKQLALLKPYLQGIKPESKPEQTALKLQSDHIPTSVTPETRPEPNLSNADGTHAPFHFYCVSGSQRLAVLCDRLFELWLKARDFKRQPSADKLQDYRRIVETIVCNLLYSAVTGHTGVRLSREKAAYAGPSRYRPAQFNERFLAVVDDLAALNILTQIKGDKRRINPGFKYFPESGCRKFIAYGLKQTRIEPSSILKQEMERLSITPVMVDTVFINEGREVLILKKGEGSSLLEYRDEEYPDMEKQRRQMQVINEMLANAGDLVVPEAQDRFDQRRRFLVRRFTHSSTESGGRLWDGFWINGMKRTERPTMLRINGEETVELDFSSMIVRLAYIIAEKPAPAGDQYRIPGLDPESRDGIKRVMGALLFDSSLERDRFPKDVAKLFTEKDRQKGWKHVHRAIMAHHPALKAYMDQGLGHYLQYLESQILVNVLIRCAKGGVTALPIHDCIIVPQSQAQVARFLMERTITYSFGEGASIPVSVKGMESLEGKQEGKKTAA